VGGWVAARVARWPKFQPKSSKGAGEKNVSWKNLWPNFGRILAKEIFLKNFLLGGTFFLYWPENSFRTWQHWQKHTVHTATAECCPLH
jgi:hypothetical protein